MVLQDKTYLSLYIIVTSYERHGVSNYRQLDCLFIHLFRSKKKPSKIHITGPLWGESTVNRCLPPQSTSDAGSVSMSWRHHRRLRFHSRRRARSFVVTRLFLNILLYTDNGAGSLGLVLGTTTSRYFLRNILVQFLPSQPTEHMM